MNGLEQTRQMARLCGVSPRSANPNFHSLLERLDHVERRGDQYRAKCPAHDGKSRSSLSLKEADDGRILIHCFGGCGSAEVVGAVGLELADLMPERISHNASPAERLKWRQEATHRDWREAVDEVLHECRVVYVAGKQIRAGEPLSDGDDERLGQALEGITRIGRRMNGLA